jgi:nitrite reductase/ring-hydroxylating ferredoxin subunit
MRTINATSLALGVMLLTMVQWVPAADGFTLVMMGRKSTGNLKRVLSGESPSSSSKKKVNRAQAPRQEITGVTLPAEGMVKGWEFGGNKRMSCANVGGKFYAVQGECPRCGFDLWKGDIVNDPAFEDLPRVACPTCSTTFGLRTGKYGPSIKRTGLAGFVSGLAKQATTGDKPKDCEAYEITLEEDGRVFCRKR